MAIITATTGPGLVHPLVSLARPVKMDWSCYYRLSVMAWPSIIGMKSRNSLHDQRIREWDDNNIKGIERSNDAIY